MSRATKRWSLCNISHTCPVAATLPLYIKNPSLFSGTLNKPTFLVTDSMRYTHKVTTPGAAHKTIIVPVQKRVIPPLSNQIP